MKYLNKIIFILIVIFTFSCKCPKEEDITTYLQPTSKEWFMDLVDTCIYLQDSNLITQSFILFEKNNENFHIQQYGRVNDCPKSQIEQYYRNYRNSFSNHFSFSIYAYTGEDMTIELGNIDFTYNFDKNKITRIFVYEYYKSPTYYSDGTVEGDTIFSTVEYLDSYKVSNQNYDGVMLFTINDFVNQLSDFDAKQIYVAKHYGLIKYVTKSGIEFNKIYLNKN